MRFLIFAFAYMLGTTVNAATVDGPLASFNASTVVGFSVHSIVFEDTGEDASGFGFDGDDDSSETVDGDATVGVVGIAAPDDGSIFSMTVSATAKGQASSSSPFAFASKGTFGTFGINGPFDRRYTIDMSYTYETIAETFVSGTGEASARTQAILEFGDTSMTLFGGSGFGSTSFSFSPSDCGFRCVSAITIASGEASVTPIPLPAAAWMLIAALGGLAGWRRLVG